MVVKWLDNVGGAVSDLLRAHAFYIGVLGMEGAPPRAGEEGFAARLGDVSLYIFAATGGGTPRRSERYVANPIGIDHLAFEVEDFEAAQRELESRGVRFLQPPQGPTGGFRYRRFQDPDGNTVYIIQRGANSD